MLKSSISPTNSALNKKILVITEGESAEPKLIDNLVKYGIIKESTEVITYGCNIHKLIKHIKNTYSDDLTSLEITAILKEIARKNKLDFSIFNDRYSDTLLIFDFDPQDPDFNPEDVKTLLHLMTDSTSDMGKLYINYPMFESIFFDGDSIEEIPKEMLKIKGAFKNHAQKTKTFRINNKETKLNKTLFLELIQRHYHWFKILTKDFKNDEHFHLYETQIHNLKNKDKIACLNTSILFPVDYFGNKFLKSK